jgi:hypothetical protein
MKKLEVKVMVNRSLTVLEDFVVVGFLSLDQVSRILSRSAVFAE